MGEVRDAMLVIERRKDAAGAPGRGDAAPVSVSVTEPGGVVAAMLVGLDLDREELAEVSMLAVSGMLAGVRTSGGLRAAAGGVVAVDVDVLVACARAAFIEAVAGGMLVAEARARA